MSRNPPRLCENSVIVRKRSRSEQILAIGALPIAQNARKLLTNWDQPIGFSSDVDQFRSANSLKLLRHYATENRSVGGSIPPLGTNDFNCLAASQSNRGIFSGNGGVKGGNL
jgi:hypothetical protein